MKRLISAMIRSTRVKPNRKNDQSTQKLADENELHSKVPNSPMNKRNYLRSPGSGGQTDTNLLIEIPV
jgi:hypothetical protein